MAYARRALIAATLMTLFVQVAPAPLYGQSASRALVRFGIVTDVHFADRDASGARAYRESDTKLAECVRVMNDQRVDFLVELGDFKDQDPTPKEARTLGFLRHIESVLSQFKGPRYHVLGNHDVDSLSKAQFLAIVRNGTKGRSQPHYTFVRNGVRFVVLDANHTRDGSDYDRGNFDWGDANIDATQFGWLDQTLAASREPVVVFVHQQLDGEGAYYVRNAAEIRRTLEASGNVLAVFQGHRHEGGFSVVNGIPYYTLKGTIEGSGSANNAYAVASVLENRSVLVTGFRRVESQSFQAASSAKR